MMSEYKKLSKSEVLAMMLSNPGKKYEAQGLRGFIWIDATEPIKVCYSASPARDILKFPLFTKGEKVSNILDFSHWREYPEVFKDLTPVWVVPTISGDHAKSDFDAPRLAIYQNGMTSANCEIEVAALEDLPEFIQEWCKREIDAIKARRS